MITRRRAGPRPVTGEGLYRFSAVRVTRRRSHPTRVAFSFPDLGGLRELGVARLVGIPCCVLVFSRPGDGVLRDPAFCGNARRLSVVQVSHTRQGRALPASSILAGNADGGRGWSHPEAEIFPIRE